MKFDLHTHTLSSDGTLSAADLLERARSAGVGVLAITDHDTIAGVAALLLHGSSRADGVSSRSETVSLASPRVIVGVELSAQWRASNIHVIGLNIALDSSEFRDAIANQQERRFRRAELIAAKLAKKGFTELLEPIMAETGKANIGRPHFARQLVAIGAVRDTREAFRKYLGRGKVGDVKSGWPSVAEAVNWIQCAGGTAVLAHPEQYHLSRTRLIELIGVFKSAGGQAIEVVSGLQPLDKTRHLASLCVASGLKASCGSDFHQPGQSWSEVGKHSALPGNCTPVWDGW